MTRDQITTAKREGIPFEIKMADGRSYMIKDEEQLGIGLTIVTVIDNEDVAHVLPLLTMTGVSYIKS